MTKREEIAVAAMQGMLASGRLALDGKEHQEWIAKRSYEIADAMIAEQDRRIKKQFNKK